MINALIVVAYSLDIIVQFLTSYYNISTGDEIFRPSWIAIRYLKGEFLIDFLSTFPFRVMLTHDNNYQMFASGCQLLKVLRIRKLYKLIATSNLTIQTKALTKIGFFSFFMFVYTHIIACVIWYFLKTDYVFVTPTDFANIRSR